MGHSFGGVTALAVADMGPKIKASIAMDPWFFPHYKDNITIDNGCQSMIIMSDMFPKEILIMRPPSDYNHLKQQEDFIKRCKQTPEYQEWSNSKHFQQGDMHIMNPIGDFALNFKSLPRSDYLQQYLRNAWVTLDFLERRGLCSHPEYYKASAELLKSSLRQAHENNKNLKKTTKVKNE